VLSSGLLTLEKMFFMFIALSAFTQKSWQIGSKNCLEACLQADFNSNL